MDRPASARDPLRHSPGDRLSGDRLPHDRPPRSTVTGPAAGERPLLVSEEGSVRILTLDRPDRLNAVSLPLYEALIEALAEARDARQVRALVLTGSGRAFSVGADLRAHGEDPPDREARRRYVRAAQRANLALQGIPKPVVAAVNGHAIGGGLELALSCDLLIVAEEAKLQFPEVSLGTFFGGGVTHGLAARVGQAKARELLLLGRAFRGEEAVGMGLANRALPAGDVLPASLELASELAGNAPLSIAWAKRLLNRAPFLSRRRLFGLEARALVELMETRDWHEGVEAFREEREPRFRGE